MIIRNRVHIERAEVRRKAEGYRHGAGVGDVPKVKGIQGRITRPYNNVFQGEQSISESRDVNAFLFN